MFLNQTGALLRKNLTYQRRHRWETCQVFLFPILFFFIVNAVGRKAVQNSKQKTPKKAEMTTNMDYPPPLFLVPQPDYRAVKTDDFPFLDLPSPSCRENASCPAIVLVTGNDQNFTQGVADKFFPRAPMQNSIFGLSLDENNTIYSIQSECPVEALPPSNDTGENPMPCVPGLTLWRKDRAEINDELFKGFYKWNKEGKINEIMAAFDFGDSSSKTFKLNIWYNATFRAPTKNASNNLTDEEDSLESKNIRSSMLASSQILVTNAYLRSILGDAVDISLQFLGEMPQLTIAGLSVNIFDQFFGSIAPMIFWILFLQLFPVKLKTVVYDKQQRLRIMMKMHGLGDIAYWSISYLYALLISTINIAIIVGCSIFIGLNIVTRNSLVIVIGFFFIFANLQIALAFLYAAFFAEVRTVTVVVNTLLVLAVALNGTLVQPMINQEATPAIWIFILDLNPWFSFFHGLMELSQFGDAAQQQGTHGITFHNLNHTKSGLREVVIIMLVEWVLFLILAAYLDKVVPSGSGVKKHPLFFLKSFKKKLGSPRIVIPVVDEEIGRYEINKKDVARETERVEHLLNNPQSTDCSAICYNLKKVYPGEDGNLPKVAVKGLSLGFNSGECFGMLGPSGSGKTSFINVMTGLTYPTSGTAYVAGLDLNTDMDEIYNNMGICPQHDLLWDILTGREHLLFYGRLKNLSGKTLDNAVDQALKSVKLFDNGVPDKRSGTYSGGMKRRLSVAISLIGDPKIVYLDEPSTGLDPASRNTLWSVIKEAKKNRGIILTTHSMEEAEHLCDRIGIFVDGSLECLGSPEQLKGRYGDTYVFSMTTKPSHDTEVYDFVNRFCPKAERVYHISGTQKFELPKTEIKLSDVFRAVKQAKRMFPIQAWGVSDTSLEDVFIKVATEAQKESLDM